MHPVPLIAQVTETSPPRYFLQGLESDESSEEDNQLFSKADFSSFKEGQLDVQLDISFKNPFQRQRLMRQAMSADIQDAAIVDTVAQFSFRLTPDTLVYFSRNHEARWSKISLVTKDRRNNKRVVQVFRQFIPSRRDLSCFSLDGRLHLSLEPITVEERKAISPACMRRLLFSETMSPLSITLYPPAPGAALSPERYGEVGMVTKITLASLALSLDS